MRLVFCVALCAVGVVNGGSNFGPRLSPGLFGDFTEQVNKKVSGLPQSFSQFVSDTKEKFPVSDGGFDKVIEKVGSTLTQLPQSVGQLASAAKERIPFSDDRFDKIFTSSSEVLQSFRKQQTKSLSLLQNLLPQGLSLPIGLPIFGIPSTQPTSSGPAPPRPHFDRSLHLHVDLIVPLSEFTESYEIEWHKESDTMRKVLEGGTTIYRSPKGDGKVEILEVRVEQSGGNKNYRCSRSMMEAPAQKAFPGLPDMSDYVFVGNSTMEVWSKVIKKKPGEEGAVRGETLTITHEILVAREKEETVPVRYSVTTDSSILGPGSDVYVQNYKVLPAPTAPIKPDTTKCKVIEDVEKPRAKRDGLLSRIHDRLSQFNLNPDFSQPLGDIGDIKEKFDSYREQFHREYLDPAVEAVRRNLVTQASRFIEAGNRKGNSFTMGVNFLADRLDEEIQSLFGIKEPEGLVEPGMVEFPYTEKEVKAMSDKLPDEFDWRTLGAVSPVRYQGTTCASCWAFAVAGSTEGALFKKTNTLVPLSPQCLVDCGKTFGTQGCSPTWPSFAYDYVQNKGLSAWDEYTDYEAKVLECKESSVEPVTHISGHVNVTANSEEALKLAIKNHAPTVVLVDAMAKSFIYYKSGILNDKQCGKSKPRLNHAVLAVGWGSQNGTHFILKNSWSDKWGDEGYIRVAPDSCAVMERPTYSLVQPPNIDRQALRGAVKD